MNRTFAMASLHNLINKTLLKCRLTLLKSDRKIIDILGSGHIQVGFTFLFWHTWLTWMIYYHYLAQITKRFYFLFRVTPPPFETCKELSNHSTCNARALLLASNVYFAAAALNIFGGPRGRPQRTHHLRRIDVLGLLYDGSARSQCCFVVPTILYSWHLWVIPPVHPQSFVPLNNMWNENSRSSSSTHTFA